MKPLDPYALTLSQTTLIEASAGTGKTFALAGLVTRYVAEGRATLGVGELLFEEFDLLLQISLFVHVVSLKFKLAYRITADRYVLTYRKVLTRFAADS